MSNAKLLRIGYFRANPKKDPEPKPIPRGIEYIEIITGGEVEFDNGDGKKFYGHGAIFRHQNGEYTIWKSKPGRPYQCLVLSFAVSGEREFSRLSFWADTDSLVIFVGQVLRDFHHPECDMELLDHYCSATINWHCYQNRQVDGRTHWPRALKIAEKYIHDNLDASLAVSALAAICGLSRPYFQHLFAAHLKTTPYQYILQQRLQKAREQLAFEDTPIKEISVECGFDNIESFYRAFKKHSGDTPARYRQQHSPRNWE